MNGNTIQIISKTRPNPSILHLTHEQLSRPHCKYEHY